MRKGPYKAVVKSFSVGGATLSKLKVQITSNVLNFQTFSLSVLKPNCWLSRLGLHKIRLASSYLDLHCLSRPFW